MSKARSNADVREYLSTFMLLSDATVLDLAGRDLRLDRPAYCVCGWALRAELGKRAGKDADDISVTEDCCVLEETAPYRLAQLVGGTVEEWDNIYMGVTDDRMGDIEWAFTLRLDQIVREEVDA